MSAMYKVGSSILVFLDAGCLAKGGGVAGGNAAKSVWAVFVAEKREVEASMDVAARAGATVTSAIRERDGGLYCGYFANPGGTGGRLFGAHACGRWQMVVWR